MVIGWRVSPWGEGLNTWVGKSLAGRVYSSGTVQFMGLGHWVCFGLPLMGFSIFVLSGFMFFCNGFSGLVPSIKLNRWKKKKCTDKPYCQKISYNAMHIFINFKPLLNCKMKYFTNFTFKTEEGAKKPCNMSKVAPLIFFSKRDYWKEEENLLEKRRRKSAELSEIWVDQHDTIPRGRVSMT